jgi:hypothetical protein
VPSKLLEVLFGDVVMSRSNAPWKFKLEKLLNDQITIAASILTVRPAESGCNQRANFTIMFDGESVCSLSLEQNDQKIALPLRGNHLPDEISFLATNLGDSAPVVLKTARLFKYSVQSVNVKDGRIFASILSPVGLPYLPIVFYCENARIFANGNAFRIQKGAEYEANLPISQLVPITRDLSLSMSVFGRVAPKKTAVTHTDVGIMGYIDIASTKGVVGWVSQIASSEPLLVTLRVDGVPLTTVRAEQARPDLKAWGIGNTKCGFGFGAEIVARIPKRAQISVTVNDPGIHLVSSPCELIY